MRTPAIWAAPHPRRVKARQPLDLTRALRLACHEGAPAITRNTSGPRTSSSPGSAGMSTGWCRLRAGAADGGGRRRSRRRFGDAGGRTGAGLSRRYWRRRPGFADSRPRTLPACADRGCTVGLAPLIDDVAREYLDNHINASNAAERLEHEVLTAGRRGVRVLHRAPPDPHLGLHGRPSPRPRAARPGRPGVEPLALSHCSSRLLAPDP